MFTTMIIVISICFSSSEEVFRKNIGENVTFSCLVDKSSDIDQVSFMFQKTGDLLSVGTDLFFSIDFDQEQEQEQEQQMKLELINPTRLDLKIFFLTLNQSGLYTCMIHQQILASFSLEILAPPRFVSYNPIESGLSLPEGSSMNLSCLADGNPSVTIKWNFQNETSFYPNVHHGEDFHLNSLEMYQSGMYECVASNGYHSSISRKFYLSIHYRPRVSINEIIRYENNSIILDCRICSNPSANFFWTKNEKILQENHSTISFEQHRNDHQCFHSILFIHTSHPKKFARYQCQASNYLGYHSYHIDIHPRSIKSHDDRTFFETSNRTILSSHSPKNSFESIILSMIFFVQFVK